MLVGVDVMEELVQLWWSVSVYLLFHIVLSSFSIFFLMCWADVSLFLYCFYSMLPVLVYVKMWTTVPMNTLSSSCKEDVDTSRALSNLKTDDACDLVQTFVLTCCPWTQLTCACSFTVDTQDVRYEQLRQKSWIWSHFHRCFRLVKQCCLDKRSFRISRSVPYQIKLVRS